MPPADLRRLWRDPIGRALYTVGKALHRAGARLDKPGLVGRLAATADLIGAGLWLAEAAGTWDADTDAGTGRPERTYR